LRAGNTGLQDCTPLSVSLRYGTPRVQEKKMTTMNPFLVQSTLPYLAPHFDQIANHHYRPAFDEGMQQKRAEIAAIALN
ncbi:hypothetical protein, partial [Sphingobacterium daejeonense]|uniref:hypothetical protein n=1 Tax=Sphingobacterium daejeonense TaxID=371142 RepID=UPI003D317849